VVLVLAVAACGATQTPNSPSPEVTVKSTGQRVPGPRGTVHGALGIRELQMDGKTEDKTVAPGYGEFAALQTLWDRADHIVTLAAATPVKAALASLRRAAGGKDPGAAAAEVPALRPALWAATGP
jgi:hypothetical protein